MLESDITTSTARVALKVEDDPCWVLLSGDGLIARVVTDTEPARTGPRTPHDAIMAKVKTTNLSSVGVITSDGSVNRLNVVDIPAIPETETAPSLSGGAPLKEILLAGKDSSVVGLINLDEPPVLVLATAQGKIKRVNPDYPDKGAIDVIKLADGDQVVGAQSGTDDDEIVLVTSNAQLLRFPASEVRPQGRSGQGIAGIRLAEGARVIALGVVPHNDMAAHAVVTIAGSSNSLPGTAPGSAKVTPLDRYPGKGRGTGGVRTQRFLRGEDQLHMAWIVQLPARAISERGKPVNLPDVDERRDGSGTQLSAVVVAIG